MAAAALPRSWPCVRRRPTASEVLQPTWAAAARGAFCVSAARLPRVAWTLWRRRRPHRRRCSLRLRVTFVLSSLLLFVSFPPLLPLTSVVGRGGGAVAVAAAVALALLLLLLLLLILRMREKVGSRETVLCRSFNGLQPHCSGRALQPASVAGECALCFDFFFNFLCFFLFALSSLSELPLRL